MLDSLRKTCDAWNKLQFNLMFLVRYLREVPFLKQNRQLALVYFLSGPHETSTPNVIFVRSLGVADYKVRILKERLTK